MNRSEKQDRNFEYANEKMNAITKNAVKLKENLDRVDEKANRLNVNAWEMA